MRRKAQITVFIIIGFIIVLSIFFYLYVRQRTTYFSPELVVPEEVIPVQQYVQSCLYDTAKNGILTMGLQSGFIEIPPDIRRNPSSYISVDPYGLLIRPYWYYRGQTRIPTEDYIRYQISRYVEDGLARCVNDFAVFRSEFDIRWTQPSVSTELGERSVNLEIDFPLEIVSKKLRKVTNLRYFKTEVPVRLKAVYELARKIMEAENNGQFLENITMDLMAANPDIPFTGMEFHCGTLKWESRAVEDDLKEILYYNIPRIRIDNTNYVPFEASPSTYREFAKYTMEDINNGNLPSLSPPSDAYEYFHFLIDVGNTDRSLRAKINYRPEYGMDFMAIPSSNGVLKSDVVKGYGSFLKFLCVNSYHFVYDITYPVDVLVRDENSFGGEGYVFAFASPVVIYHNQGNRVSRGAMTFQTREAAEGFCEELGQDEYIITAFGTYEGYTDTEIPDVNIDYECLSYRCSLGETKADEGYYRLRTRLPQGCANPFLIANRSGYLTTAQQVLGNPVDIKMKRLRPLKFTVVKHVYQEESGSLGGAEDLAEDEKAVISVTLVNATYSQSGQYPILENYTKEISLVEDNAVYAVDIVLLQNDDFVGGYSDEGYSVSFDDIIGAEEVEFHVFEYRPTPVTDKQKAKVIGYLADASYREALKPRLR